MLENAAGRDYSKFQDATAVIDTNATAQPFMCRDYHIDKHLIRTVRGSGTDRNAEGVPT